MSDNADEQEMQERGLMVKEKWANLFVQGAKTMEIRSFNCRVIKPGALVWVVMTGEGKNSHGITTMKIVAQMRFVGNVSIRMDEFSTYFDKHQVTKDDLDALMKGSKKGSTDDDDFTVTGWEFENVTPLERPRWIRWRNETGLQ